MRQSKLKKTEVVLSAAEFKQTADKIESLVKVKEAMIVTIADLNKKKRNMSATNIELIRRPSKRLKTNISERLNGDAFSPARL